MARMLVMMVTCSACGKTGQDDGFFHPATFTVDAKKWEYDFCETCLDTESLVQLVKLGSEVRPEKKAKKAPATVIEVVEPGAVPVSARGGVVGIVLCPECQEPFKTEAGLAQHRSRKHDVLSATAAELVGRGSGPYKCPKRGCKYGAAGNQGLSAHMRAKHGVTLAEYRESRSA